jgi:hypothetical protein
LPWPTVSNEPTQEEKYRQIEHYNVYKKGTKNVEEITTTL